MAKCVATKVNVTKAGLAALDTALEAITDTKYLETIFIEDPKTRDNIAVIISKT